ncbi:Uncharacterised protein [Klebsiella pneumoniae]|uniref:Uncharacterized protein n=1 Tax=Klebsiella pneumoniae TaxID=573 RepID=A0A2X3FNR1_KLEPN|nr:Uncharacterised protein [Klebsiella pneumoniae]
MHCNTMPYCKFNMVTINHFQRFTFGIHTVRTQNGFSPEYRLLNSILYWSNDQFWLENPCHIMIRRWIVLIVYKEYGDQAIPIFILVTNCALYQNFWACTIYNLRRNRAFYQR